MNVSSNWAKARFANSIIKAVNRAGFQLTRPRFHEEHEIDLRALLAQPLELTQGKLNVLQIGANDGVENDPIHEAVSNRGWHLYAVEPLPAAFARLCKNYEHNERVKPINCAIGSRDGEMPLYTLRQDPGSSDGFSYGAFSSFSREVIEKHWRHVSDLQDRLEIIAVPTLTLSSLIDQHEIPTIDLLQIDVEGLDFEILKMAFQANIYPPIVAFEWTHLSQVDMWQCRTALIEHGYRWLIDKGDVIASKVPLPPPTYLGV